MAFNADHHKEPAGHQQKAHEHGKSHEHNASSNHHQNPASHHENPADHHQEQADHHKQASNPLENTKDDCCKDEVAKFEKSDKQAPKSLNFNINPAFSTIFILSFNHFDVFASYKLKPDNKYFVRSYHPPIREIRIAIQSFLI